MPVQGFAPDKPYFDKLKGTTTELVQVGEHLRVTPAHPIYVNGTWVPAGRLASMTSTLTSDLHRRDRVPVRRVALVSDVYDISVAWPNNFFAGGMLVHNKPFGKTWHNKGPWMPWARVSRHPNAKTNPIVSGK